MSQNPEKVEMTHVDRVIHSDDVKLAELGYKSEFKREFSVGLAQDMLLKMTLAYINRLSS
jgi:hypothetical protein